MNQYLHLIGTEEVNRAGQKMNDAAGEMSRASSSIADTLERHQRFMSEWLVDFERILTENGGDK